MVMFEVTRLYYYKDIYMHQNFECYPIDTDI